MAAVTRVLGHIWIPLASGRAEHRGPIKACFPRHRTVNRPSTTVSEEVERGKRRRRRRMDTEKRWNEESQGGKQ